MLEMGWFERKKSAPSANGFRTIKHQRIIWFIAEKYICLVKVSAIPTFILVCNYLMLFLCPVEANRYHMFTRYGITVQ